MDLLDDPPRPPARRRGRGGRTVALVVFLALVVALGAGAVYGGRTIYSALAGNRAADWSGDGQGAVVVQVREGDTASAIGATLAGKGVVASAAAFSKAAQAEPRTRSVQPGYYRLRQHMSAAAAVALLLDPASRDRTRVTLAEGLDVATALQKTADSSTLQLAALQAAAAQPSTLGLPPWSGGKLEGFLFPATYDVEPGTTATQALVAMTTRFSQAAQDLDLVARAAAIGQSPYAVLITASLIEKETAYAPDRSKVARVVYNRLAAGMPLQFDSTVNYLRTDKKARLTEKDLQQQSPYNTYLNKGLPPTPINSPGEAAIEAALTPAAGDYIYFVTVSKDGSALFTSDYQAFLAAKAKAQAEGVY